MKSLNVLFVKPLVKFPVGEKQEIGLPLSYLYLGQFLKDNTKHGFSIIDYRLQALETGTTTINPENDFKNFDVISIGSSSSDFPETIRLFKIAKQLGKITILGGIFPSQNKNYCLNHPSVDYLVSGEGEVPFSKLLNAISSNSFSLDILKGIAGVSFRDNDQNIVHNEKQCLLTEIPEISAETYHKLPLSVYQKHTNAHIMCTRGCPFGCNFCSVSKFWHRKYRTRPIANIIREMRFLKDCGFKRIHLKDETLTLENNYSLNLFEAIRDEDLGLGIKLKSRVDGILSSQLLDTMISAGVDYIHFGVETMSDRLLQKVDKGGKINSALIDTILHRVLDKGININPIYIMGIPGQTIEDIKLTLEFIEKLGSFPRVIVYSTFWTPHPENGLFPLEEGNKLFSDDLHRFTHKQPITCPDSLGREQLIWGFDQIALITGNRHVNPKIEDEYKNHFLSSKEITTTAVPFCN